MYRGLKIKFMEIEHLARIYSLGKDNFNIKGAKYKEWSDAHLAELYYKNSEFCFVAMQKKKILGFVLGSLSRNESNDAIGSIEWLYDADFSGDQELSRLLFQRLSEEMGKHGVKAIFADEKADNCKKLDFYRKIGFREVENNFIMKFDL